MNLLVPLKRIVTHTWIIDVLCRLIYYTILPLYEKVSASDGTVLLLYHNVIGHNFKDVITHLRKKRFTVIPFSDMIRYISAGRDPPHHSIVVTFDDGLRSIYTEAYPVVLRRAIPIIVFLVCGFIENEDGQSGRIKRKYLNIEEIRKLQSSDLVEFGSHTISHPCLVDIPLEDAQSEIRGSKKCLEQLLGVKIVHFAVPYGGFSTFKKEHVNILMRSGLKSAVINVAGVNNKNTPLYELRRVAVTEKHSKYVVEVLISGLLHKAVGAWKR